MIDFSTAPYNDDFDPNKHFHRILFKPGKSVQARELTQLQTITQDQISKFADNIFAQNTPVSGGNITINQNCFYLKLIANNNIANFTNKTIVDSSGSVVAKVLAAIPATIVNNVVIDPPTLIVAYSSGTYFSDNDLIYASDLSVSGQLQPKESTGKSSTAHIADGVFYVKNGTFKSNIINPDGTYTDYSIGNFVSVQAQTVVLDKYDNSPTLRIGLSINESIYDFIDDVSLLDPALGASNYQAPGADRYVINLTLETRPLEVGYEDKFIELARVENGVVVKQVDGTSYSIIDDYIAKRTYDTNGDFIVNPFKITPQANTLDANNFILTVSKGLAYVRGYRIDNQSDLPITIEKARTTQSSNNDIIDIEYGNYLYVSNVHCSSSQIFDFTTSPYVDLHVVSSIDIDTTSTNTYKSTLLGNAILRNMEFSNYSNVSTDTTSYIYKAHIINLQTNKLTSNITSTSNNTYLNIYDPSGKFSQVNSSYNGVSISTSLGEKLKISNYIYDGVKKTIVLSSPLKYLPTKKQTLKFTLAFDIRSAESMVIANTTHAILASADMDAAGKINQIDTGDVKIFDSAYPELVYNVGLPFVQSIVTGSTSYVSTKRFSNLQWVDFDVSNIGLQVVLDPSVANILSFAGRTSVPLDSDEILNNFMVIVKNVGTNGSITNGTILDFTSVTRSVTIASDGNSVQFLIPNTELVATGGNFIVDVIAKVNVNNADDTVNVLKLKTLVSTPGTVNVSSGFSTVVANVKVNTTTGQTYIKGSAVNGSGVAQSLYVSDVKNIVSIIDTGDVNTDPTTAMLTDPSYDITSNYEFNNGQNDHYYDFSYIKLKNGLPKPAGNILVCYNYYNHSGGDGYFSVMSYDPTEYDTIGTYTAKNGQSYNLRDCLDFRLTRLNATNTLSFNFTSANSGAYIPENLSSFTLDYFYYIGRKDLLVLTKDKSFSLISGTPKRISTFPQQPEGSMLLAKISLDPYTKYTPDQAPSGTFPSMSVETIHHKGWTMDDITNLQTRIDNLEYYTALNLLEQKSQNLQIPNINGINRFKNGILVDNFSTYTVCDTANKDFAASVNTFKQRLEPLHTIQNFILQDTNTIKSMGNLSDTSVPYAVHSTNRTSNQYTLPYTVTNVVKQQLATGTLSANPFNVVDQQGVLEVNPPIDFWVDNNTLPSWVITSDNLKVYLQTNKVNVLTSDEWKIVPGTQFQTQTVQSFSAATTPGVLTITTITTNEYAAESQTSVLGNYQQLYNTYGLRNNNGFLVSVNQIPFIRSQEIFLKGKSLAINTPITTQFDGITVSDKCFDPDIIELTNVTGTFNEADLVGFYENSKFYALGMVVDVVDYGTTPKKSRLYIIGNYITAFNRTQLSFSTLRSVKLDKNGNYVSTVASGTITDPNLINMHKTGLVSMPGEGYYDQNNTKNPYYKVWVGGDYGGFAQAHGIWGNPESVGSPSGIPYGKWKLNVPVTGDYFVRWASSDNLTGKVTIDGTLVLLGGGSSSPYTSLVYPATSTKFSKDFKISGLTAVSHYIEFEINNPGGSYDQGDAFFALAISTVPFVGQDPVTGFSPTYDGTKRAPAELQGSGNIIFSTSSILPESFDINGSPVTTFSKITHGGVLYSNVTKFALSGVANNQNSSAHSGYYVGCGVNIQTSYVDSNDILVTRLYNSTITAYDNDTLIATLDTPISISVGMNGRYGDLTSKYSLNGTYANYKLAKLANNGISTHSTTENGSYATLLHVPSGTFKSGQRIIRMDDRRVSTDPTSAVTFCQGEFYSSGLATTSRQVNFGASIDGAAGTFTSTREIYNVPIASSVTPYLSFIPWDPLAQTFIINKESFPNGLFLSSITLFFKDKPGYLNADASDNTPITLKIVSTQNGYPSGEVLDHSIVTLHPKDVNVSDSPNINKPNTATVFKFNTPVYIQPGVLYAFVLKSPSSKYELYIANKGDTVIGSTTINDPTNPNEKPKNNISVGSVPYVGNLFESQNGHTWVPEEGKALMMTMERCKFNITSSPTVYFGTMKRLPYRKSTFDGLRYLTDEGSSSGHNNLYADADILSDAYNIAATDFTPTDTTINYQYNSTLSSTHAYAGLKQINPGKIGCPTLEDIVLNDGKGERVLLKNVASSFYVSATLSSKNDAVTPIISDDGVTLYNINYTINNLPFDASQLIINNPGLGYYTSNVGVSISAPDVSGGIQATANVNLDSSGRITGLTVLNPGSGYLLEPTLTFSGAHTTAASCNVASEFYPSGGNSNCKYITKKVVMIPGNDSQDLRVFFTAYRPQGSNIYVFYKVLDSLDTSNFNDNNWQLMTIIGNNRNVYSKSLTSLYEYEAAPGTGGVADGFLTYTGLDSQEYDSFIQFAIKIVMTSNDPTNPPYLDDIRAIALPRYTGL